LQAPVAPAKAIRRFVQAYVGFLLLHPELPALMQREILDHAAEHALPEIQASAGALFRRFAEIIRNGQESGDFRTDIDPVHAVVSIIGQVIYAFMAQPIIQGVLLQRGGAGPDAVWLREFGVHAADFALRALAPDPVLPRRRTP